MKNEAAFLRPPSGDDWRPIERAREPPSRGRTFWRDYNNPAGDLGDPKKMTVAAQKNRAADEPGRVRCIVRLRLARRLATVFVCSAAALWGQEAPLNPASLAIGFAALSDSIKALAKQAPADCLDVAFPTLQQAHLIVENLLEEDEAAGRLLIRSKKPQL